MNKVYQVYQVSDSTGETLDRIFSALKAQFSNFNYTIKHFSFVRTNIQIDKILLECKKNENSVILYTIVDNKLIKYLDLNGKKNNIPCFGVLGDLILNFSKLLNQEASHKPSGQHVLDEEYYKKIEAIQFTMAHDDGKLSNEVHKSDIILFWQLSIIITLSVCMASIIVTSSLCPIRFTLEIITIGKLSPVVDGENIPSVRVIVTGSSSCGAISSNATLMVLKALSADVPEFK